MLTHKQQHHTVQRRVATNGCGLINTIINKLPVELHLPGYQFCGPGTRLRKRLARGERGINPLDSACREHDIAYAKFSDLPNRHAADKVLQKKAWERYRSRDDTFGNKAVDIIITS